MKKVYTNVDFWLCAGDCEFNKKGFNYSAIIIGFHIHISPPMLCSNCCSMNCGWTQWQNKWKSWRVLRSAVNWIRKGIVSHNNFWNYNVGCWNKTECIPSEALGCTRGGFLFSFVFNFFLNVNIISKMTSKFCTSNVNRSRWLKSFRYILVHPVCIFINAIKLHFDGGTVQHNYFRSR